MLNMSESQMVVFFYISVEYSRIYKRKMARGKLNIDNSNKMDYIQTLWGIGYKMEK